MLHYIVGNSSYAATSVWETANSLYFKVVSRHPWSSYLDGSWPVLDRVKLLSRQGTLCSSGPCPGLMLSSCGKSQSSGGVENVLKSLSWYFQLNISFLDTSCLAGWEWGTSQLYICWWCLVEVPEFLSMAHFSDFVMEAMWCSLCLSQCVWYNRQGCGLCGWVWMYCCILYVLSGYFILSYPII